MHALSESHPEPAGGGPITPGALRTAVERASRPGDTPVTAMPAVNGAGSRDALTKAAPNGVNGAGTRERGAAADVEDRLAELASAVAELRSDAARLQRSVDTILERLRLITG